MFWDVHLEIDALRALGLTEYGARAYRALVSLGASEASVVASAAPVPRTKVYAVLGELAKRGWLDVEEGRPRRYRARRPTECFDRERARVGSLVDTALPLLEARYRDRSTRFGGPLWILQGVEEIERRGLEMLHAAKSDVLVIASFPMPGDEKAFPRALREAIRRGVRVRAIVPDVAAPHARALAATGAELRVLHLPPRALLVDGRQALLGFPVPRPGGGVDVKGVWNPAPDLLEIMGFAMAGVWDQAQIPLEAPAAGRR